MNLSYRTPTAATATEVAPALLAAVFQAAGGDASASGQNVHWNIVLHHFVTLTGLSMDAFGVDTRGYPRLKTAISGAWGALKKNGMAAPSPRRTYCLTPLGTAMAMGGTAPTPTVAPTPDPVSEPAAPTTPSVVIVEPKGEVGVSWEGPMGTATPTHESYENDAYFRRLASEKTRCFGKWSARAAACKGCPLASLCQGAQVSLMSEIGSGLDVEFARMEEAAATPAVPEPTPEPVVEEARTLPEGAKVMPVAFETVCSHCNQVIPEGDEAAHISGRGAFHMACAYELS